jgi:hypothetical protein
MVFVPFLHPKMKTTCAVTSVKTRELTGPCCCELALSTVLLH